MTDLRFTRLVPEQEKVAELGGWGIRDQRG